MKMRPVLKYRFGGIKFGVTRNVEEGRAAWLWTEESEPNVEKRFPNGTLEGGVSFQRGTSAVRLKWD